MGDNQGHVVQPLTTCGGLDVDTFLAPVEALQPGGGTTLAAGMQVGRELLGDAPMEERQRRILFLTDMGEMSPRRSTK